MQMFFVVVLAILTVISWYGFIRCMVNPNWLRQKGEEAHGRRYYPESSTTGTRSVDFG
ncbi:hypothetical protein [Mesosutterella multiformis]|uniref:hypothetical protein n=1 Tax=Mesosutterella multiformis TaxID=2259133 RepID=UPI000FF9AAD4|nr:hypothetical protein [Mesosutterella multiformis]GCB31456.1 hypothetical protein KGMB02707_07250 [Mesosutterella multiformis]